MSIGCITPSIMIEIGARIARNRALLTKAEAALEKALDIGAKSYMFGSGNGSQRTTHRDLKEIKAIINELNADIRADTEFLSGAGVVSMNLRRNNGYYYIR